MAKVYFNTRDELCCVDTDLIAVVTANGNYSRIVYITKSDIQLSVGISKVEEVLKQYNSMRNKFIRLGRSVIVNHAYMQKINLLRQFVVLSDNDRNEIRVSVPKNILKTYKDAVAKSIKIKEQNEKSSLREKR